MERSFPDATYFELLLTEYKMPQIVVHALKREGIWDVRVDREMRTVIVRLNNVLPQHNSTGKIDLTFYPLISLDNHYLDHLFDYNIRIAPTIGMNLWKGARLTLQALIPIAHRLTDRTSEQRYVQFGVNDIEQQIVSTKHWNVSAAAGFFKYNRVGVQAKVEFHTTRNLDFSIDGGITGYQGFARVIKNRYFAPQYKVTKLDQWNLIAKADYYEPHTKLEFELQGGRWLFGDYGARFDLTRHFGEYAIGLYGGIYTGKEKNVGFHFAIPLGGKRQKRNGFIRVRLPEYFNWEYYMENSGDFALKEMGQRYNYRPDDHHSAHYWEPAFVEEYIERILNGTFK
ncbi:MAG: hypothetical protein K6F94_05465 [Bacteroidaceae bacterium]|nr:hypothetical protein [Bacteroidaceae bacterium]